MSSSQITLKTTFEYPKLQYDKQHKTVFMSTLQAPKYESEQRQSRSACDIVCVIDRSGSMGGEKIELVKKTLIFMLDQLKDDDQGLYYNV
jgi:Mg-chelatase subunit ChlD